MNSKSAKSDGIENALPSGASAAQNQNFLAHLHYFLCHASTSQRDVATWSHCGFYFQIQHASPQFSVLLAQYFPNCDCSKFLTLLKEHGINRHPQGSNWYFHPQGYFYRDRAPVLSLPPVTMNWYYHPQGYLCSDHAPVLSLPPVTMTGKSENAETKANLPSTLRRIPPSESKTRENEKAFAAGKEQISNAGPKVDITGINCREKSSVSVSGSIRNGDPKAAATGDDVVAALNPLDAQEMMGSAMHEDKKYTRPSENDITESNTPSAQGSNDTQEPKLFESEEASAHIKETTERKDPTVTESWIPSFQKFNVPGDKDCMENSDQMVTATCDRIVPTCDLVHAQETIENAETGSNAPFSFGSISEPENKLIETETAMTTKALETDNPTLTDAFIGRRFSFPCDKNGTKDASQTASSECDNAEQLDNLQNHKPLAIADLMLLTQCNSVDESDFPRKNEELFGSVDDTLSTQFSIEADVFMADGDDLRDIQGKSDEESVPSDGNLLSTQCPFIADESMGNVDDVVVANGNIVEQSHRCVDDMENDQCEDLLDEKNLGTEKQTDSSSVTCKSIEQSDAPLIEIKKSKSPDCGKCSSVEAKQEAMECNESTMSILDRRVTTSTRSQRDVSEKLPAPCDVRAPFLQRNRKRTSKRKREPQRSTLQSILRLNESRNALRTSDICAPELNVPSRAKASKMHNQSHYRVHILTKESSGRVTTSTMSFCLTLYQCHFCVFNGSDKESIWQHCSSSHGDQNLFYPVETVDGVFHLLVEERMSPQRTASLGELRDAVLVNQPSLSIATEPPRFKDVFRSGISLPVRQYYHDVTFHPIGLSEWLFVLKDIDRDPEWRGIVDTSALFEMTDILTTEKLFMTLWNDFMRSHPILSEIQLSSHLVSFVQEYSSVIIKCDLEEELMAHIVNMWVEGHIGRWTMLEAMKIYKMYADQR